MHPIDVGHVAPRAPWGSFAPQGPGHSWPVADAASNGRDRQRSGGCARVDNCAPSRGTDFVRQLMYTQVVTSLRADYRVGTAVPVQGLSPAESATQSLASAASQALAPGGKGADALRDSVDAGLADASSLLQELGINGNDLASVAEDLRSRLESFIGAAGSAPAGTAPREAVAAAGASFTQKQKTQVEIVTQEGDTVRLSLRSRVTVAVGGVASTAADGKASSAAATVIAGSKFEISVDGNLNDDEIAAIRDVLTKVEDLADDFFAGDVEAAFAAAADLDIDGGQLASVALDLRLRQRLSAADFFSQPAALPVHQVPVVATPPVSIPSTPVPVVDALPANQLPDAVPANPAAAGDQPGTTDPAPTNPPQGDPAASPGTTITAFLMQLLDSLQGAGDAGQVSMSWKFKLELLMAVSSARVKAEPAPNAQSAADKLGETLNAMA